MQVKGQLFGSVGRRHLQHQTDVSYIVGQVDQESTVNINSKNSKDSLNVTDDTPSSPKKASPSCG